MLCCGERPNRIARGMTSIRARAGTTRGMAERRKRATTDNWSACKRVLKDWPRPGVVALVRELYQLSDDNRRFLHARLLAAVDKTRAIDDTAKVVRRMLKPQNVWNGRVRHGDVKRVIDRFEKGADDAAAVAHVLLADLDEALQTFAEVGDYEPIVKHIYATMTRLEECLKLRDVPAATPLVDTLVALGRRWADRFGWGVSDELLGMAEYWRERVEAGAGGDARHAQ
jgi:hypothetical protein